MKHLFYRGTDTSGTTLLLLHGTGGNENDLLPLAGRIAPDAAVLSVRGTVLEQGMPRFFRRLAEGIFDETDLIVRTQALNQFLDHAAETYDFDRNQVIAIGYSNGANIAASLLFHYPRALRGAILHHPMVPRRGIELPDLTGVPVFIAAGNNDPICDVNETKALQSLLKHANADVSLNWLNDGHRLTSEEVDAARGRFYEV
jgi:phospholipase/carboxylesterase